MSTPRFIAVKLNGIIGMGINKKKVFVTISMSRQNQHLKKRSLISEVNSIRVPI